MLEWENMKANNWTT